MIKVKKRNKIITLLLVVIIAIFSVFISPVKLYCSATSNDSIVEELNGAVIEELNQIDFSSINAVIDEFKSKKSNIFSLDNIKNKIYEIISGENSVNYSNFFASLFSNIIEMVAKYLPILSLIIAIGVISNLLGNIKSKFNEKSTGDLIHLVCFLTIVVVVIGIISNLAETTGKSINSMVKQMNVMFPILLTLMVGIGANASVGVFQPVVAIMSTYVADIFNYFILPLFMLSFVFGILSNISNNVKLDKFSLFISGFFKWSVGLIFTLFFAVFTIQGISAGSFDSIGIRTTKYTIKSYVPIMGGYLSEGLDLIMSSTVLIKNAVGLVGVLLIITTILSPIIEIAICSLLFKLVSAILQPLGNAKTSAFLSSTSKAVTMLSSTLIAVGFMYLISTGLIMTTSNVVM